MFRPARSTVLFLLLSLAPASSFAGGTGRTRTFVIPTTPAPADAGTEITRESVIAGMNACRIALHLLPLREDPRLDAVAEDRMHDMEDLGYWAHVAPDGRPPFMWYPLRHYTYHYAGENLATGFETEEILMESWMESPGHRDNIMNANYRDVGVAIIEGSTKGRGTGRSIVVAFGAELSEP